MNQSSYLSNNKDYNMPTPPWKAGGIGSTMQNNNSFPIPPRTNDRMAQKSTNSEWNKAGGAASDNFNGTGNQNRNSGSFNSGSGGYSSGYGDGNQGVTVIDYRLQQNNTGLGGGGGNLSANFGNNRAGFGSAGNTGGFKDNIVYNNQNRPTDGDMNRSDSFNRGSSNLNNSYDRSNSFNDSSNASSNNIRNTQNQDLDYRRNQQAAPKTPSKNLLNAEELELEKKALDTDVSQDFFAKIKPLSLMQVANDVALRYARQEYYIQILGRKTCPEKPSGSGQYTCKTCYMNFLTKEKLATHNNSPQHKELDDLFRIKKEQARLIMEKRITGPTPAKLDMKPIAEAEIENSLNAAELELDVYILGIYESVMKPYWPVPKSTYYCRMCNYLEFSTEGDFRHHNSTNDHKKREATYEEAFCLYCQRHYNDKMQLATHVSTTKHIQIKNLMERAKEAAMDQWHKANNIVRISEKSEAPKVSEVVEVQENDSNAKAGSKRSAAEDENISPVKKPTAAKPTAAKPMDEKHASKGRDDLKRPEHERSDSRSTDKKSSNSAKSDTKSTPKPDSKAGSKVDTKAGSKSKGDTKDSKSDSRNASKSDSKYDSRNGSKSDSKSDPKGTKSPEKDKMWFVNMTCTICIACRDLMKNEDEQKAHAALPKHLENIKKLKNMMAE